MSKLTLDQAIKHLEDDIPNIECQKCKEEHEQLLKWLKTLEIIKTKEVAVDELKHCIENDNKYPALEEYNAFAGDKNSLTQEELDILKEMFK